MRITFDFPDNLYGELEHQLNSGNPRETAAAVRALLIAKATEARPTTALAKNGRDTAWEAIDLRMHSDAYRLRRMRREKEQQPGRPLGWLEGYRALIEDAKELS